MNEARNGRRGVAKLLEGTGKITMKETPALTKSSRLVSLDAFRGITIAGMILVNNPGGPKTYAQLEHADWQLGFSATTAAC